MSEDRNESVSHNVLTAQQDFRQSVSVPWNGFDVLIIFAASYLLMPLCVLLSVHVAGSIVKQSEVSIHAPAPSDVIAAGIDEDKGNNDDAGAITIQSEHSGGKKQVATTDHPLTQLIRQGRRSPFVSVVLTVAFLSGVILAPLTEEFMFRLVLQGWLQDRLGSWLGNKYFLIDTILKAIPVIIVAVFFASLHGGGRSEGKLDFLLAFLIGIVVAQSLIFTFGILYLTLVRQATARQLGFDGRLLPFDILLGFISFVLSTPPILAINALLKSLFPDNVVDPVPLFFLALVLGTLYYQTKRIQPCIALHAFFNGFSFLVLVLVS